MSQSDEELEGRERAAIAVLQRTAAFGEAAPFELTASAVKERGRKSGDWRSRRTAAVLVLVAASVAAVVLPLALVRQGAPAGTTVRPGGTGPVVLTDTALTPRGWAPVDYGMAQISVPGSWTVEQVSDYGCQASSDGVVWLGGTFQCSGTNLVRIVDTPTVPAAYASAKPIVVNGIKVFLGPNDLTFGTYFVPSLGVEVRADGPLASRILSTLTRSPLEAVLERAAETPPPHGWRWYEFAGVQVAAPGAWSTTRKVVWDPICGIAVPERQVTLDSGTRPFTGSPACPLGMNTAAAERATPGLVVATGRYEPNLTPASGPAGSRTCLDLHGLQACLLGAGSTSGVLPLSVTVPGQSLPTVIEVGLAGDGAVAREIVDSIGPAG